jgi:hypothetical protein
MTAPHEPAGELNNLSLRSARSEMIDDQKYLHARLRACALGLSPSPPEVFPI